MPFDPTRLQTQLLNTQLQSKDSPLYQLLFEMIRSLAQLFNEIADLTAGTGGGGGGGTVTNNFFTTQQLLMNNNQSFQKPIMMGIPTGTVGSGSTVDHVVLSDGVVAGPTPVDDGAGNFIYIPYVP